MKEKTHNIDILKISDIGGDFVAQEIIKRSKDKNIIYMTEDTLLNTNCVKQLAEFIETLIAENKELKEKNNELEVINKMQEYRISVIDERELISKSKVEEILKKYKHTEIEDSKKIIQFYKDLQSLLGKE